MEAVECEVDDGEISRSLTLACSAVVVLGHAGSRDVEVGEWARAVEAAVVQSGPRRRREGEQADEGVADPEVVVGIERETAREAKCIQGGAAVPRQGPRRGECPCSLQIRCPITDDPQTARAP